MPVQKAPLPEGEGGPEALRAPLGIGRGGRRVPAATSFTERYPWLIAFIFGLFHGLGFAGALSEIGVPEHEVPLGSYRTWVKYVEKGFFPDVRRTFSVLRCI